MDDWLSEAQDYENFDYDATESTTRRKTPKRKVLAEDKHLKKTARKTLQATTRDVRRNEVTARWALSKHIDFVAAHSFQPNSKDSVFNEELMRFYRFASARENFDISGRYGLDKYCELAESARVIDGDFLTVRQRGGYVQAIESDRIQDKDLGNNESDGWVQGVKVDRTGRPTKFSIHRRVEAGFEYERTISAKKAIWFGFWDRFDQTRGISPLAAVINTIKDLNESYDYALAKAKVAQLFALSITRDSQWGLQSEDDGDSDPDRVIDFDKSIQILDLDSGEEAKFLSNNTPESDTQAFWQDMTALVLKSLNIPFSFWNESFTNFNGSRTALILYLRSVEKWRRDQVAFRNDWFKWRLKVGQLKGEISLPSNFEVDEINWRWIPTGIQYWDAMKEANADIALIEAGLRTRSEIRRERFGDDWDIMIEKSAEETQKLKDLGLWVDPNPAPQQLPQEGKKPDDK